MCNNKFLEEANIALQILQSTIVQWIIVDYSVKDTTEIRTGSIHFSSRSYPNENKTANENNSEFMAIIIHRATQLSDLPL